MFCRRARNWISLALDGALPPDRTVALTRHLESCPACREYERDLQTGRRLLAASAPQLSEGFEWRLQLRLSRTLDRKSVV
jgi:anti-sigma factor RsiW